MRDKVSFLAGPWESLDLSQESLFDIILMSETLYNTAYYPSLLSLISRALSPSSASAQVLIGTKTFYYGLGGGYFEF